MPHRLYDDNKIKLILLYLLHELDEAFDFQTISEIIVWDGSINYFVFTDCFNQLVENGAIEKITDPDGKKELYAISQKGKVSIEAVEDTLLKYIKERIMRSATRLLAFKNNGSNVSSVITEDDGGFHLSCSLHNKKFSLLDINLYLDNKEEAELLKMGFDHRAEQIYGAILALLSDDSKYLS